MKYDISILLSLVLLSASALADSAKPAKPDIDKDYFQVVYDMTHTITEGYQPAFGYAVYVNYDGKRFLFDTGGDGNVLLNNLKQAGVNVDDLQFVAISHDHGDHAGGLRSVHEKNPFIKVYAAPGHDVGVSDAKFIDDHIAVTPKVLVIRSHTKTPTAGISDELSLLLKTDKGPYLFTGCSHTGVGTILKKAEAVAGEKIFHYTGGARLMRANEEEVAQAAKEFAVRNVTHVSPGHCSVSHEVDRTFIKHYEGNYSSSRLGEKVSLN